MDYEGVSPIGLNVARYRKIAGMSAAEVADAAGNGLTRSVIANLENGRKDDVTVTQLFALSAALQVPPAYLVIDTFRPRDRVPYPMPEMGKTRVFDLETGESAPLEYYRNAEAFKWFGARTLYGTDSPNGEHVLRFSHSMNAYESAAKQFARAVRRLKEAKDDARQWAEGDVMTKQQDIDYAEESLVEAAEGVIWAMRVLTDQGVVLTATPDDIVATLNRLGVAGPAVDDLANG